MSHRGVDNLAAAQDRLFAVGPQSRVLQYASLSFDGSEGNYYSLDSIVWSPDSKNLAAYRVSPGYHRKIQYVESSPLDQLQPKYSSMEYAKPGDTLDIERPVLVHVAVKDSIVIDNTLFPNPYGMSNLVWRKDSRGFTFEYNKRGHQVYRVIEVSAATGTARRRARRRDRRGRRTARRRSRRRSCTGSSAR